MAIIDNVADWYGIENYKIGKDYFNQKHFQHETTNNIIVKICRRYVETNPNESNGSPQYKMEIIEDISDKVIDYSYECDYSNNVRQTASITLKVDTDCQTWFMRRENKCYEWIDDNKAIHSITWLPVFYQLIKTYECANETAINQIQQINLGYFIPISNNYNYDATNGQITINLSGLSAMLTKEYGGTVTTYREGKIITDPKTGEEQNIECATTLSLEKDLSIDGQMLYDVVMGSNSTSNSTYLNATAIIPLQSAIAGDYGQKLYNIPYQIDFDADIGRMDILEKISEIAYEGGNIWVDENRILHLSARPVARGALIMKWCDYSELFLSETISYDDSNFYNYTEVYGGNNEYYGFYDESGLDGGLENIRKQVISVNELESNKECLERAKWENYKARYGRETISVTIVDKYIMQFQFPSNGVGTTIEYTTVDGDTNLYFLNKLSYNSNKWTMELQLFKPLYLTDEIRYKRTLETPEIYQHEVINNNTLRLYVRGSDIQFGVVKIYGNKGALGYSYIKESCDTNGNDNNNYKIVDIPIDSNGKYYFWATLYSPYFENSGYSANYYMANVTEIIIPALSEDPDPYPHPNMFEETEEHAPYLTTPLNEPITTNDGDYIII